MSVKFLPDRRQLLALALGEVLWQAPSAQTAPRAQALPRVPLFIGTGEPSDRTPAMLDWVAQQLALQWDYQPTPWLRAQMLAAAGHGLMYGLARTPQRERELRFSQPIWTNYTWAVIRQADARRLTRATDFDGQPLCWTRGSNYSDLLGQLGLRRLDAREAVDDDGSLRMLAAGRCRATLITLEYSQQGLAGQHPALAGLQEQGLTLMQAPLAATALHFVTGLKSPWGGVLDRIDQLAARSRPALERLRHG